ncbi:uncharacterized protein [Haliotis cracherodii]|uniref:uncharacterized protein n=1 Tax=Haliotis cracherodii TaxID=6455 RepID=UPI0039EC735D
MTRTGILLQVACAAVIISRALSASTLRRRQSSDIRCLQCDHVSDPADCDDYSICGHGEICSTREFIDHHDMKSYRMGCQSSQICSLYKDAATIFGRRRDVFSEDEARLCFDCCSENDCNSAICTPNGGGATPLTQVVSTTPPRIPTRTSTATATTTKDYVCPSGFKTWKTSCYSFSQTNVIWDDGRKLCQDKGADLVSINTQEEDSFITNQLENLIVPDTVRGMWLGSTYDDADNKFKWVDGTDVSYGRFKTGSPRRLTGYSLVVINPAVNSAFAGWPWGSDVGSVYKRGFICEMKQPSRH